MSESPPIVSQQSLEEMQRSVGYIPGGLSSEEAARRLNEYRFNEVAREKPLSPWRRLWVNLKNPLVILLSILGIISLLTGDARSTLVIFLMVILGIVLRYVQEMRADKAAEKLKAMVSTHATVCRDGKDQEIPLKQLVPADVIRLGAGDMVPADVRLLVAKDLFLNQAALTGESMPIEKNAAATISTDNLLDTPNVCFLGSNVESGATAMVIGTGDSTSFGSLASHITGQQVSTISEIRRFILVIGPVSSIFDYVTFFVLWHFFDARHHPALFHTGWFIESLFSQTLIIHVIRTNKIPFIESRASWPLTVTSIIIVLVGVWLTVSPLAPTLGFVRLPNAFWGWLAAILVGYVALTQVVKNWLQKKYGMQ